MLTYPSVFLSHNSADRPIVEAVARELGRRGVMVWLEDLNAGMDLSQALIDAIRRQTVVAVFLSPSSVKAPWVDYELESAFKDEEKGNSVVVPICLGNKFELVNAHNRLQRRLLTPDGQRINRVCIVPEESDTDTMAGYIARKLAASIFARLNVKSFSDVMIYIDQRGSAQRFGIPGDVPLNLQNNSAGVGLVFRPDHGMRSYVETLHSQEWTTMRHAMKEGLDEALAGPRWNEPKRIYVLGNGQTGLFYLVGRHFDRNSSARLYCSNTNQIPLTNDSQEPGATQLKNGNPNCEAAYPTSQPLVPGSKYKTVSVFLGPENYVAPVQQYLQARKNSSPLLCVKSGRFTESAQAMSYVADVVALLTRLRSDYSVRTVRLFNALPVHLIPLLAANLLNETGNLVFMEYRRDLEGENPPLSETYVELEMC